MLKIARASQTTQSISNIVGQAVSVGAAPPPFPTTGLVSWWDFSDLSTITKDGSNLISKVLDKYASNDMVQATGSKQPLWVDDGQNSLDIARFDGSDDFLKCTYAAAEAQPLTIFIVCTQDGADKQTFDSGTGNQVAFLTVAIGASYRLYAGAAITGGTVSTAFAQFNALFDGSSSDLRRNKTSIMTGNVGSESQDGLTLAANPSGNSNAAIDIGEVIVYGEDVSDEDRDLIETYLGDKWL